MNAIGFDIHVYVHVTTICKKYFIANNFGTRMANE